MHRILSAVLVALLSLQPNQTLSQTSDALKIGAGISGIVLGGKVVSKCMDHVIICTTVTIGGLALTGRYLENIGNDPRRSDYCPEGFVDIYRVVGWMEHRQIQVTSSYQILPLQIQVKQFWFTENDAEWFSQREMNRGESNKTQYLVKSKTCVETISEAVIDSDVGHAFVSFAKRDLPRLNSDAAITGGILSLGEIRN